jgi:hypothetical protein
MSGAYLFHAARPIGNLANRRAMARHYLGWADCLERRTTEQAAGNGQAAALMRAFRAAGVPVQLVRTWPGASRTDERRLKNRKNAARLCPVCRGER